MGLTVVTIEVGNPARPKQTVPADSFILRFLLFGALQALIAASSLPAAEGQARVKLATLAPRGTSFHQTLQTMGEKWRQSPGGGVALTIYPDGTMGGEANMVRKMRAGQIQAAMLSVGGLSEIEDSVRALQNMPMMFHSLEEVDYVREKLQPALEKKFLEKGFVILFWGDAGWVRFFSRHPAVRPDDFKKLKMFAWSGDNNQIDIMKSAGYHPVPLEYTDTLTG
ncbi:MAG: TRAP transporter substrate-binding protein DctP, partial [Verrucomicrobia bacterium]|nr:TRAP transporter substrate-binding protein DctP [Verrucomicrobiota bacterium]